MNRARLGLTRGAVVFAAALVVGCGGSGGDTGDIVPTDQGATGGAAGKGGAAVGGHGGSSGKSGGGGTSQGGSGGKAGGGGAGGSSGAGGGKCGNGVVDPGEQCDLGAKNGAGTGCETDCSFSCIPGNPVSGDAKCDDKDLCNGAETCGSDHTCHAGTAAKDGTTCGTNKVCHSGTCIDVTCGDGIVEPGEECDDGNTKNGDGCDTTCKLSCVSTDPTRDCKPADPCQGMGTCNDTKHTCTPGTPLADGTKCNDNPVEYCANGVCKAGTCGDGVVQAPEQCDDGANNGKAGDGCKGDCTFACADPTKDCLASPPACEIWTCDATHVCKAATDPAQEGTTCGNGLVCKMGSCVGAGAICGNGVVEAGEECDFGTGNGAGTGCESTCKFSCETSPTDTCAGAGDPCAGAMTCGQITVNGATGQVCSITGQPQADGTPCGTGMICNAQVCKTSVCGDGIVDAAAGEQCDDGNAVPGDGCEPTCKYTCSADGDCTGAPVCEKGVCGASHTCSFVADATQEGMTCGAGLVCKSGACVGMNSACGNGVVETGEQCDFGTSNGAGTGCETNCQFSCTTSPDSCTTTNVCAGALSCQQVSVSGGTGQKCVTGTPPPDGTSCGTGDICLGGTCKVSTCGDGFVDAAAGEQCDFGAQNGAGTGCETTCKYSCTPGPTACAPADPCQGQGTCSQVTVNGDAGYACTAGTPLADGTSCGTSKICKSGTCVTSFCGDGFVDTAAGEQCDFGAQNGAGTGCETTCKFSCGTNANCDDGNACNGTETCGQVVVNGDTGQKCFAGTALADGTSCGTNQICLAMVCKTSTCGDGYVNTAAGEQCEPPNTATCDSACHNVVVAVCGNGVREGTEQCDDGNTTNLDGCDATCKFEQDHRVDYLVMQFATDATFCPKNALGAAISGGTAQGQIQTALTNGVADGSISILFKMLGLDDLSGTSDPMLQIGVLDGSPYVTPNPANYNGASDLDWWYKVDPLSIDASRTPLAKLSGAINAKLLTGGPGTINVVINIGGSAAPLTMANTTVSILLGSTSIPLESTNGMEPGHLPSENLDPTLSSYATAGQQNTNGAGKLCGQPTAASLAKVPVPMALTSGFTACNEGYSTTNSLLDVLIGGCTVIISQQIKPTQPDTVDPGAPVAGAGGPYKLTASKTTRAVTGCTDKSGKSVDLMTCLNAATYTSFFKFASDRVIIKP